MICLLFERNEVHFYKQWFCIGLNHSTLLRQFKLSSATCKVTQHITDLNLRHSLGSQISLCYRHNDPLFKMAILRTKLQPRLPVHWSSFTEYLGTQGDLVKEIYLSCYSNRRFRIFQIWTRRGSEEDISFKSFKKRQIY